MKATKLIPPTKIGKHGIKQITSPGSRLVTQLATHKPATLAAATPATWPYRTLTAAAVQTATTMDTMVRQANNSRDDMRLPNGTSTSEYPTR